MLTSLIAFGVFDATGYATPAARTLRLPGINVNCASRVPTPLPAQPADAVIDYQLDWSRFLLGDTIASASIEVMSGDASAGRLIYDASTTSFFVSGGTSGTATLFECLIRTPTGRVFEFVFALTTL